ncbi:prepilin-type N-terminal cleavage/methylation domain-containing protein [Clostridium senegalense]|uniref:prepilin-type N-terminal cleavage/methylation domain-containing protein n=1 Tax=Clostridium senegalense TaxID=1465809 RepID=UPI000289BDE1|nr:prepilin-type N-terminal cleavage/methylation domain-containing protein [Clostridium senegalense]
MRKNKGITLIELIVTMGILMISVGMFFLILKSNLKVFDKLSNKYNVNNNCKIACNHISNIIKYGDKIISGDEINNNPSLKFLNNNSKEKVVFYIEGSNIEKENPNKEKGNQRRFLYTLRQDKNNEDITNLYRYEYMPIENKIFKSMGNSRYLTDVEKKNYLINSEKSRLQLNEKNSAYINGDLTRVIDKSSVYDEYIIFQPYKSNIVMAIYFDTNNILKITSVKEIPLNEYENYNKIKEQSQGEKIIAYNIKSIKIKNNGLQVTIEIDGGCREKDEKVEIKDKVVIDRMRGAI